MSSVSPQSDPLQGRGCLDTCLLALAAACSHMLQAAAATNAPKGRSREAVWAGLRPLAPSEQAYQHSKLNMKSMNSEQTDKTTVHNLLVFFL